MTSNNYKEIYFIVGGHPKSAGSNRMAELATDLDKYRYHKQAVQEFKDVLDTGDMSIVSDFFDKCNSYNIHIVGSKDYVYRSDKMQLLVNLALNGDLNVWEYLPRTLGLRDAVQKYCDSQKQRV